MTWHTTHSAPFDETQEHGSEAEAESWAAEFHARTGKSVAIWDDELGSDADSEPATGDLSDFEPSGVVLGAEGER